MATPIKKETTKKTDSKTASGKVALSFKSGTKNASSLTDTGKGTSVQQARRKQAAEGVAKSDWVGSKAKHNSALSQPVRIANMQADAKIVLKKKK